MWHPSRRLSPIFGQPTLSWEYLPYHLNLREEEALLNYNSGKCPYELRKIVFTDKLLVQKIPSRFESSKLKYPEILATTRKKYKVMDTDGIGIFYLEQMYGYFGHLRCEKYPINYKVFGEPDEKLVMSFTGSPGIFGGGGEISAQLIKSHSTRIHLGDVVQETNFCNPIFTLKDCKGNVGFSIQGPDQGNCWGIATKAEFNICQHKQSSSSVNDDDIEVDSVIGKLYRNARITHSKKKFKWIIEFPRDLDPATKVTALSAAFLLESQFFA